MSLSIGILANNEAAILGSTLVSLFAQDIFAEPVINASHQISKIEIVVVANGCSDNTADVATHSLTELIAKLPQSYRSTVEVVAVVEEVEQAGKSNAWNLYTHEFSDFTIDLIVMMDADIEFNQTATISNSIETLLDYDESTVVVDTPLKSLHRKTKKTMLDRISLRISQLRLDSGVGVSGSFYCARAATLKQVWMPQGLPAEDGFLKAMIITNMFRSEIDHSKIVRAPHASHFYVPETSIGGIVRHELREIIGTSINCFLTWDLLLFATDPKGPGAGIVLKNLIDSRPEWLQDYLMNTIKNKGFWVLPRGMVTKRLMELKRKHVIREFKFWVAGLLRFLLRLPLYIVANQKLKSGSGIGYW